MGDMDAVVHTAAQQARRTDPAYYNLFFDTNVKGAYNVLQAALEHGISRVVISSSIVVCGNLSRGGPDNRRRALRIDESIPLKPENVYDLSKAVNEQTAEFYARVHGMKVTCLRYGGFFAKHEGPDYVTKLLSWYVHTEDVAQAIQLALESRNAGYAVYVVVPKIRFTDADSEELVYAPNAVLERCYPEEHAILRAKGMSLDPITMWWDSSKAQRELGFRPQYNFEQEVRRCLNHG
jgi:nucleoside-diphosphate-sugar epimerase